MELQSRYLNDLLSIEAYGLRLQQRASTARRQLLATSALPVHSKPTALIIDLSSAYEKRSINKHTSTSYYGKETNPV
jgi:hypothetical protein